MKGLLGAAAVGAVLGIWAGFSAWQSAAERATFEAGFAIVLGGTILLCILSWYRAAPGSGDALVLPLTVLLIAAMLLGILPKLLWPEDERLRLAGSIASLIAIVAIGVAQVRRRRALRRAPRPTGTQV